MANVTVTIPGNALEQIMGVYEGQVPPNEPVEYRHEPNGDGSIDSDDLHRVLEVVRPLWDVTPFPAWALKVAETALERFPPTD